MSTDVSRRAEFLATGRGRRAARIAVGSVAVGLVCLQALAAPGPAWRQEPGYRWAELPVPSHGQAGFTLMAPPSTGVLFTNVLLERRHLTNQILLNGAGVAAGDVNGDGWCDLYFNHSWGTNALFLNRGDWRFEAVPDAGGASLPYAAATGATLADLDGDGDLIANGMERAARDLDVADRIRAMRGARRMTDGAVFEARRMFPRLDTPNLAFRNRGDLTFEESGTAWGVDQPTVSHGLALADLDNDGDLDLVMNNLNGAAGVYRNNTTAPRVAVRLKGAGANPFGIGARVLLHGGPVPTQADEMQAGGRYLSGDDSVLSFAAGAAAGELALEVRWPHGGRQGARGHA